MSLEERACRTLRIHKPWAWMKWPSEQPLVQAPPETAGYPSEDLDWYRIFSAVHAAISRINIAAETLYLPFLDVEVSIALTEAEHEIATSWVSEQTPVSYRYENGTIIDGYQRLWHTRKHHGEYGIPVLSESFAKLGGTLQQKNLVMSTPEALGVVAEAACWWDDNPGLSNWHVSRSHEYLLALAYLELSAPAPVPAAWFERLADWNNRIEVLAGLHAAGRTDAELLDAVLHWAWRNQQDRTNIDRNVAVNMFRVLGFRRNGKPARPPRGNLTLYRGATEENRAGPSWTLNPEIAGHFASTRQGPRRRGKIWAVTVPASSALAYLSDEQEFVVDLTGHEHLICEATPKATTHRWSSWKCRHLRRSSF